MNDPETFANNAVWYTTGHSDCAAVFAALDERSAAIRAQRQNTRKAATRRASDRVAVGIDANAAAPDLPPLAFLLRPVDGGWAIGLPCEPRLCGVLAGLIDRPISQPGRPAGGEITWSLGEACTDDVSGVRTDGPTMEDRIEAILADLLERASRRGVFGPEHDPREIQGWCQSPAGRAACARARGQIAVILRRSDCPSRSHQGPERISRGRHLTRRSLAERLRIVPVSHEGRCDAAGDWGGPRRILAQTADGVRRLFISEGHSRSVAGRKRSGYTPASLWLQGDAAGGLFTRNVVIYRGRVTREVLSELTPRIEAGLDCPGLGPFLALYHTVTVEPDT